MKFILSCSLVTIHFFSFCQPINPAAIDIVRDAWGVPHIFSKTDAGVAYGLAWAHAEDDFKTIQLGVIASKAMLGRYNGKSGAVVDYAIQLLRCRERVDEGYAKEISAPFKAVLEGYCEGLNAYAKSHPHEILLKRIFPVTPRDMLTYSVFELAVLSGADQALATIFNGTVSLAAWKPAGSNGYAFNSKITTDGNTYLAINSHQPLEGPVAWYEAHLCSDEGWNILGALFPGSPTILHGCNEYLGWAHTVNAPDKLDIYQLELNPTNPLQYKFDGQWLTLEEKTVHLKVKVAGIIINAKKKIYHSVYGPTIQNDRGTFSVRLGALMDIRPLEQWYRMTKAKNFTQFRHILDMEAISGFNIIYADRYDTVYYLSNAKLPIRNPSYSWTTTLPGNTSKTLWNEFHPISDLPQVLQPASGYVFNSNNSPFNATGPQENIHAKDYDPTMGYEISENNRSLRFMELMKTYSKINYDDFKKIKYDLQLPRQLAYRTSCDTLFMLSEKDYPTLSEIIHLITTWDRRATADSRGAAVFAILYYQVADEQQHGATYRSLTKKKCVELLYFAQRYIRKHFGATGVTLGEYQKLVRGNKAISLPGLPDVIAAMRSVPYKKGMVRGEQGESYIELVKFTPQGPVIESVNCYGASNVPGNPHYADQMEMFVHQKTKQMTLDKNLVYQNAKKIYHPQK